jgi:hypothetical protein
VIDDVISTYFAAWNETDPERRRVLLEQSLCDDAELKDPTGRWPGVDGLMERIDRYHEAAPGTEVIPSSGIDAHNDVVRYAWEIVDGEGKKLLEGIDVAERATDGKLHRIMMFHGPLAAG